MMGTALSCSFDRLLAALPPIGADVEVILRPTAAGPSAVLRREGSAPEVHLLAHDGVRTLRVEQDTGLRGARMLTDAAALSATLTAAGAAIGPIEDHHLVAWRPGRRAVLRLTTANGTAWLKLLDQKSFARAERVFAAVGQPVVPMRLMLPRAMVPALHGCVVDAAPGVSLRALLADGATMPLTTVARSVLALGYTGSKGELPTHDFERARAAAAKSLLQATHCRSDMEPLAAAVASIPSVDAPARPGFVHGDLHDKQLFIDGERAAVIDLEGLSLGDVRFDVVNLAEHLRLRELQRAQPASCADDLLLERCGVDPAARSSLAFRAVVRARLCGVYALRPRWHDLFDRLRAETLALVGHLR